MAASLPANTSAVADGYPPPTPMGGERSSLGRRHGLWLPQMSLAVAHFRRPGRYPQSFTTDVSTAFPTHTVTPSSDLPVAPALLALPWIPPPHQGLQAAQACCDVGGEGTQPAMEQSAGLPIRAPGQSTEIGWGRARCRGGRRWKPTTLMAPE
jgi:hypothetical protein